MEVVRFTLAWRENYLAKPIPLKKAQNILQISVRISDNIMPAVFIGRLDNYFSLASSSIEGIEPLFNCCGWRVVVCLEP